MDWIEEFLSDVDDFDYNIDFLLSLLRSSTFDADKQRMLEAEIWALNKQVDLIQILRLLLDNQLSPMDVPGRRMSAADIHNQLKKQGL